MYSWSIQVSLYILKNCQWQGVHFQKRKCYAIYCVKHGNGLVLIHNNFYGRKSHMSSSEEHKRNLEAVHALQGDMAKT